MAPVPPPTSGACLVFGYLLLMFNSCLGVGTNFPRKKSTPLGSHPIPAHPPAGHMTEAPASCPGLGLGVEATADLKDTVPAKAQPPFINPQPWNVCGPISRVSKGSPRALIILQ